jgi:hypothetical protein
MVVVPGALMPPYGQCFCGCITYRHGLEREFDEQFSEATGRRPAQTQCRHCGNWFAPNPESGFLVCLRCAGELNGIRNG